MLSNELKIHGKTRQIPIPASSLRAIFAMLRPMLWQASCSVEPIGIAAREHGHRMKWLFALLLLLIALHGDRASASTRIHTKSPGSEVSWAGPLFPGNCHTATSNRSCF